jgi:hypothetical protein
VTRYYYGAVPNDSAEVEQVRLQHASTALLSIEVAKRIDTLWKPPHC